MTIQSKALAAAQAVCPVVGMGFSDPLDKSTWRLDFAEAATQAQKDAAQTAINNFDIAAAVTQDARGGDAVDAADRLLFEVNFDQENRIRALEGKAAVTRAQYRTALINAWKSFNP